MKDITNIELGFFTIFLFFLFFWDNAQDKDLHDVLIEHYSCERIEISLP